MSQASTTVSYESDIKPLFRDQDQQAMSGSFDLWSYDDVRRYATPIVDRLRSGTMPCDQSWPEHQVDLFQRWIDTGMAP